jgi:hypothetical protein
MTPKDLRDPVQLNRVNAGSKAQVHALMIRAISREPRATGTSRNMSPARELILFEARSSKLEARSSKLEARSSKLEAES